MGDFTEKFETTVYFGSFFRWTPRGIDHIIEQFYEQHVDKGNVPAVGYDPGNNAFLIKTSDRLNITLFSKLLHVTIADHQKQIDHTGEEFMVPLEHTTLSEVAEVVFDSPPTGHPLIDIDNEESDDSTESSSGGVPCAYWTPDAGDISILTDHYATNIANLTDCVLYKEPDSHRVKVMNGQIHAAMAKLVRLEPMLSCLARHRDQAKSKMDYNFLSFSSQLKGTGVRYQSIHTNPTRHRDRIMVQSALKEHLDQMLIGEERVYDEKSGKHSVPDNLRPIVSPQPVCTQPCAIWSDFVRPPIGSKGNASPRMPSGGNSSASSDRRPSSTSVAPRPSRYLRLQEQAGIREWSKNVDGDADPTSTAVAVPLEHELPVEQEPATIRRAVEDSDSASELDNESLARDPPEPTQPKIFSDSSDSGSDLAAVPPGTSMFQRTRMLQSQGHESDILTQRQYSTPPSIITQHKHAPQRVMGAESFFRGVPTEEGEAIQNAQSKSGKLAPIRPVRSLVDGKQEVPREHVQMKERRYGGREHLSHQDHRGKESPGSEVKASLANSTDESDRQQQGLEQPCQPAKKLLLVDHINDEEMRVNLPSPPSRSASSSSGGLRQSGLYTPQTQLPKPDIPEMRQSMMQQLMSAKSRGNKRMGLHSTTSETGERVEPHDEVSSRKYHSTMNLKTNNPGKHKGKQSVPTESTTRQKERIKRVKEELMMEHRAQPQKSSSGSPSTQVKPPPPMSKKALQAARNNAEMGSLHLNVLRDDARKSLSKDILQGLKSALEAARFFPGRLQFELQVGQLLSMCSPRIDTKKVLEAVKWKSIFTVDDAASVVRFSNMLTNHGPDIDDLLETKTKKWKTWSRDHPGPANVTIEFQCLDSLAQPFTVVLQTDGTFRLTKCGVSVVKIGIHCPGRIWDVCAVIGGVERWDDAPTGLQEDAHEFIASVYVGGGAKTTVSFRPPTSNCFTVQDVVLKRQSLHDCQVPENEALQLQVIEVKVLSTRNHRADRRLHLAVESDHAKMADEGRVHYEVCIVHKDINEGFEENRNIEVGEQASANAASMLNLDRTNLLIDFALRLVDKMDWIGGRNYGTLVQMNDEKERRRQEIARTFPPGRDPTLIRPVHLNSAYSVAAPRTTMMPDSPAPGGYVGPQALPIHGIRSGTQAQVYEDLRDGSKFFLGQGGARIPLPVHDDTAQGRSEIVPDDSASQMGGRPRRRPKVMGALPEKPETFW